MFDKFVQEFLDEAVASKLFAHELEPLAKEKSEVQPFVSKLIDAINIFINQNADHFTSSLRDVHTVVSFAGRKPDTLSIGRNLPMSICNITGVSDNKGRLDEESADFSDENKGALLDFGLSLMSVHSWRTFIYLYLVDGHFIQFFKLTRAATSFQVTEYDIQELNGDGGKTLLRFLSAPLASIGHTLPQFVLDGKPVVLLDVIGHGSTSTVFLSLHNDLPVVTKVLAKSSSLLTTVCSHG